MNFELLAAAEGRPLNFGSLMCASAHARVTGPCGDTLQIWLRINGNKIRKASFVSNGCEESLICCSTAAYMVEGMHLEEAGELSQEKILTRTPPISPGHRHCALLAANTIKQAIAAYSEEPAKVALGQRIKQLFIKEHDHA